MCNIRSTVKRSLALRGSIISPDAKSSLKVMLLILSTENCQ